MTKSQDRLLEELDALNERQIEAGLVAGVWDEETRPFVENYLSQLTLQRIEAEAIEQAQETRKARDAAVLAMQEAMDAKLRANAAVIMALGAMLASFLVILILVSRS
jgi:hypothetical protein